MDDIKVLGDRYELIEPIGRGGMATIFRAQDRRMGRPVAVKILREMYSNDPKFVLRFQREARAVSALAHPNIVQVFDYGQSGEEYFIVMELIEGVDLRKYLRANGILDIRRAVVIGHDVALALGAAHRRGIVHRDVKPQNILVNDEGLVKLTDFGIATFYRDVNSERLTTTGMTLGTVQYYAPEQAQGEVVTPAADVYALGIVLYEMLVGHPPFDGDTPVSIAVRHIQEVPIRPSRYNPAIPPGLERVIMRCLEKDPRDRYRDGDALAYALESFDRPRTNSGRMATPLDMPPGEMPPNGGAFRGTPSGALQSTSGRGPSGARPRADTPSSWEDPRALSEDFIMPGPTRPDVAAGVMPVPALGEEDTPAPVAGITTAIIVASVLLLLAVGCFVTYKFINPFGSSTSSTSTPQTITVPDFTNKMYQPDAVQLAQTDNIHLVQHDTTSTKAQIGLILRQDPAAGTALAPGGSVNVYVGIGPNTVTIPAVANLTADQACAAIKAAQDSAGNPGNLVCVTSPINDQAVPVGLVVKTSPQIGDQVSPNTIVTVYVSIGPVSVPTATPQATATPTISTLQPTATPTIVPTATSVGTGVTATPTVPKPTATP